MIEAICKVCNKPIRVKNKEVKPDGNYCSKACWYASKTPRLSRRTGAYKNCAICGKEIYSIAARPNQQFCSRKCKGIGSRLAMKACVTCGKEFKPVMGRSMQPCCSKECGYIYRRQGDMLHCDYCGKEIYVEKSRQELFKNYFCNKEHFDLWFGRNKTVHTCKICGKEFKWSPSRTQSGKYNVVYCSLPCRDADPERREMLIAMNAKQQRMSPNKVERIGYGLLDELGIEYQPQYLIGNKFCVDAFVPSLKTIIQFDGDYWHFNPEKFQTPDSRQQKRIKLDKSQDAYMEACGYSVIRIWASDLEKHLDHVRLRLQSLLVHSAHSPSAQE